MTVSRILSYIKCACVCSWLWWGQMVVVGAYIFGASAPLLVQYGRILAIIQLSEGGITKWAIHKNDPRSLINITMHIFLKHRLIKGKLCHSLGRTQASGQKSQSSVIDLVRQTTVTRQQKIYPHSPDARYSPRPFCVNKFIHFLMIGTVPCQL